jgi:DNA-binding NarL/FixJ family response regulator
VLLVEDQMIVAMQIEDMLHAAGCEVVGPVGTVHGAITLAKEAALDVAVLDIDLDGEKVYPVAEELQARGIPFILATGYGESTLPENRRDQPRLSKPFQREQLEQLLRRVINPKEITMQSGWAASGRTPS